jgi:hypothetical protein
MQIFIYLKKLNFLPAHFRNILIQNNLNGFLEFE